MEKYCSSGNIIYLSTLNKENANFGYNFSKYILENIGNTVIPYNKNSIFYKRALDMVDMLKSYENNLEIESLCSNNGGITNISSSCYLDSIFMTLFFVPNNFINQNIVYSEEKINACSKPIREEIQNIINSIRNGEVTNCRKLRNIFKLCPHVDDYHKGGPKDAIEFLTYILDMFPVNKAYKRIVNYVTNKLGNLSNDLGNDSELIVTNVNNDKESSIIQFVESFRLEDVDDFTDIRTFIKLRQDTILDDENLYEYRNNGRINLYKRRIEIMEILDSEYLVFGLQRKNPITEEFINKSIIPTKFITLESGRQLRLLGIVVYLGSYAHYTTYILCNDTWYYYDDLNPKKLKRVGNYLELLKSKPSILTNGVLYFYG